MEVLGLTPEERRTLFGGDEEVGFGLRSDSIMPKVALLFQMEKADGKKVLYVVYNCSFSPAGFNATSVEDGIEEATVSLDFTCIPAEGDKPYFYYAVDTAEAGAESVATNFFTTVQFPA